MNMKPREQTPADDLGFILGITLAQIRVSRYSASLNFHQECQLAIESHWEHQTAKGALTFNVENCFGDLSLFSLLEASVTGFEIGKSALLLFFSNGETLSIGLNGKGSSCMISTPDRTLVFG